MAEEQVGQTAQEGGHKLHFTKPTKRQMYRLLLNVLFIIAGNALAASASAFFIIPNGFVMGGTTGLGIFVRNALTKFSHVGETWTDWAVEITVYTANIALFVTGAILLGKKFAIATGAGTFLYPTFLSFFTFLQDLYAENHENLGLGGSLGSPLLAMLCGASMFGLGVGLVLRVGASTGGTDIPPLIFKKYFNAPISVTMWCTDFSIVALNLIAADSFESVLCGVFITFFSSVMAGKISLVGMNRIQVKIISTHYKEIRDMIIEKVSRGVTVLYGQTGYLKQPCHMLLTVISSRQLVTLKSEVQKIDPNAFMTISNVSEVRGKGFHTEGVEFLMPQEKEAKIEMVADTDSPNDGIPEERPPKD